MNQYTYDEVQKMRDERRSIDMVKRAAEAREEEIKRLKVKKKKREEKKSGALWSTEKDKVWEELRASGMGVQAAADKVQNMDNVEEVLANMARYR